MRITRPARLAAAVAAAAVAILGVAGCSSSSGASSSGGKVTLHLGYFPNLTHAAAIVGTRKGFFAKDLGKNVTLDTKTFNAGPDVTTAIFSGAIDASYIGPNPTINAYAKSKGSAVRVISGATSGGAALVVKKGITSVAQLKGKKIAAPQLGNTQDVALRYFLEQHGLKTDQQGGGDAHVVDQDNSVTLQTFAQGAVDGAWVPEPYASRLVLDSGGHVLVNEKSLWPEGRFVTTQLIVRTQFLKEHPDTVEALLRGQADANDFLNEHTAAAQQVVNAGLKGLTGKSLPTATLAAAWKNLTFTNDPIAPSLKESASHAEKVGLLAKVDLKGLYDLGPLNTVLKARHETVVSES